MKNLLVPALLFASATAFPQGHTASKEELAAYSKAYVKAKTVYQKHHSQQSKAQYVACTDRLAFATMTSEALPPRTRYPDALGLYQEALRLDPKNHEALNNAAMIDSVYKGMMSGAEKALKANPHDKQAAATLARLRGVYKKIHRPLP